MQLPIIKAKGHGHKYRFVGREKGYHGMNLGGMSVGGMINNVKTFASVLMPGVLHMRHTMLPEHKFVKGQPDTGAELADDLERFVQTLVEKYCSLYVEPIQVRWNYYSSKGYLQRLRKICDNHGILLILMK